MKFYEYAGGKLDVLNGPTLEGPCKVELDESIADDLIANGWQFSPVIPAEENHENGSTE